MAEKVTVAEMRAIGVLGGVLSCLVLSACSGGIELPPVNYTPASPPVQAAVLTGVKAAAAEAKLGAPLEISGVRSTDHGPGSYFVCLKGTLPPAVGTGPTTDTAREPSIFYQPPSAPSSAPRVVYYSVFFDGDIYKGARQSVIMDACETQAYSPVVEPTPPAPTAKPGLRRKPQRAGTAVPVSNRIEGV